MKTWKKLIIAGAVALLVLVPTIIIVASVSQSKKCENCHERDKQKGCNYCIVCNTEKLLDKWAKEAEEEKAMEAQTYSNKTSGSSTSTSSGSSSKTGSSSSTSSSKTTSSSSLKTYKDLENDPIDYDDPDDYAEDAWEIDFDDYDDAYEYWEDY